MKFTPENIEALEPNEVFVFGSNLAGIHGAGAAKLAYDRFGAKMGTGIGMMGKSYAIPTKDKNIKTLPLDSIKQWVKGFLMYAEIHPDKTFIVTKIGCGLAGYDSKDIAPFFKNFPTNVVLPKDFYDIIISQY